MTLNPIRPRKNPKKTDGYSWKDLKEDAKDAGFVLFLFWLFLSGLGLIWPIGWSFVFAMMLGFLLFDVILSLFMKGRTIPITGDHRFKPEGWVFAAYLIGIATATILSTLLSQGLADFLTQAFVNRFLTIIPSGLVGFLLYADFSTRGYWRGHAFGNPE